MFKSLRIHGTAASVLWGYRRAATLRRWSIAKVKGKWILTGAVEWVDAFQCRQTPLIFTAVRDKGHWCWEIADLVVGPTTIRATLGPPLQ